MNGSVLLIDDDPSVVSALARYFERARLEVFSALTAEEGLQLYEIHRPDVTVLDLKLPDRSGLDVLQALHSRGGTVILLTAHGDIETAVHAVKSGAENFLTKPVDLAHLDAVVERALEKARLKRFRSRMTEIDDERPLAGLGTSKRMRELAAKVKRVAEAERTTVLLLGESGTGKGWLAERIHRLSPRADAPFVEINCSTLTGTFLESELFGHQKGAFTDAKNMKRGMLEVADGGTIFLDEVGDLELSLQPKLLKMLESRSFRRIGGTREINVDVRVCAASNRDLPQAVSKGDFREDLFYRLNVMPIALPPLRERSLDDIVELSHRLFDELMREFPRGPRSIGSEALAALTRYRWPGNVRELRNVLERARIVAGAVDVLQPAHLPPEIIGATDVRGTGQVALVSMEEMEKRHIKRTLLHLKGNRTRTAKVLGISRATLHSKLNKYGLERAGLEADDK
ncbi:MAG: sigma-54-dependent Fis family transcriptional regulator [Gemmatimonadetes bacterium]|uniref:Sigma-54-dependent Fis family transcriptional regulator n=1 Tax=Candidatus Kutchimonas denitrificans TaxID=3056748 RepID=A0AAE5CBF5_9BACT|nr:sigma-54-dependent Fis family transcriptional regulator [Gemmatimonadota bacterium]NIR74355.1 sigma-54-dependent Fis family transcriptional regulator [Candidatus Kutchimonas denitrificans]NIS02606.1 sigma-54-dependent Fis family transcriptional regulator [Gemmatimonadota bacterium]NIT68481.1 sigma-54-dependent Fis family transcriptional regulator [Gemmatimonadota bacterium]NIU51958.1 response regulator [Gemmatimonadota bacterium]